MSLNSAYGSMILRSTEEINNEMQFINKYNKAIFITNNFSTYFWEESVSRHHLFFIHKKGL